MKKLASFCLFTILLITGCNQQNQKKNLTPEQKDVRNQALQLKNAIVATCDLCSPFLGWDFTPRDATIARNPGIEQDLYLTVVDDEGKPVTCCKKPMRLRVDAQGNLALHCGTCGKLKPVAVHGDKVVVVEDPNN